MAYRVYNKNIMGWKGGEATTVMLSLIMNFWAK